jgi:chromosome segregation ATPase
MGEPSAIEHATQRLKDALDALESAMDRRAEFERNLASLGEQVHAFESDRSRLAADLDTAMARTKALEGVNRDIAAQLDTAIEGIRGVIDLHEAPTSDDG